ncbi:PfkB family carbohydrate kinase [Lachnospiraceae bacterium 54-53]
MTIKEIAQLAGVSISTVSKIVNNKDSNITLETRNRVLKIVKDYNYSPYSSVKNSPETKTFILGLLLSSNSRTSQFINGAIDSAQKNGYSILICDSMENRENELKNITSLCKKHVDGVIWEPVDSESPEHKHCFDEQNIEVCFINSKNQPASYNIDFISMGYAATEILLKYGHTKVNCLTKLNSARSGHVLEGFKKCLVDHGIAYQPSMNLSMESEEWYGGILTHTPTGIVSTHYDSALLLMEQLSKLQLCIPADLSLISLRDDIRDDIAYRNISSIKIPYYEFGAFVCSRLIEKCEKTEAEATAFCVDFPLENDQSLGLPFDSREKKILVVGSINIDVTLNVDELPQPGRTVSTSLHSVMPGGKGANQAVGAAKLGKEVVLIGKVGSDYDSNLIYTCMEENHVDVQGLKRDPHSETGKAYIHVQEDGESAITILAGANHSLSSQDILLFEKLFENTGYCLLQTEVPEASIKTAARLAKKYGAKNILKPAAMKSISPDLMGLTDIFVPNRKEAELLCPEIPEVEMKAKEFLRRGAKNVIITLGHSGCYMDTADYRGYLPTAPFPSVDTTGAADAFISALAVHLLDGCSMEASAKIASYAAGFCVSRQGVIPALIDKNSLQAYIYSMGGSAKNP